MTKMNSRHHSEGSKYAATESLRMVEVAKLVRADLRAAHPGVAFSVRLPHRSGTHAMDVTIKGCPFVFVAPLDESPHAYNGTAHRYSEAGRALFKSVKGIVNAYNFDDSDSMTDYFHVRFYERVAFDHDLESAQRAGLQHAAENPPESTTDPAFDLTRFCT